MGIRLSPCTVLLTWNDPEGAIWPVGEAYMYCREHMHFPGGPNRASSFGSGWEKNIGEKAEACLHMHAACGKGREPSAQIWLATFYQAKRTQFHVPNVHTFGNLLAK